jgi:hypothetical protein
MDEGGTWARCTSPIWPMRPALNKTLKGGGVGGSLRGEGFPLATTHHIGMGPMQPGTSPILRDGGEGC